jgi:hypothetical protein
MAEVYTATPIGGPSDSTEALNVNAIPTPNVDNLNIDPVNVTANAEDKKFLSNLKAYLSSNKYKEDLKITAKKYKLSEEQVAKTFLGKVLGALGDALRVVVKVCANTVGTIIAVIDAILNGAIDIAVGILNGAIKVATFNKTLA